jgi:homoserine kinase
MLRFVTVKTIRPLASRRTSRAMPNIFAPMLSSALPLRAHVYAPGGIGNIGPGLDVLGCAVSGAGDSVELAWADEREDAGIVVADAGHPELPTDPRRHAAAIAASAVLRVAGEQPRRSLVMRAKKGLPLAGGQGGSAASAVAGAVAMNVLLGNRLDEDALLAAALDAEAAVAGRHADNVAPALLGGVVLVRSIDPLDIVRLRFPPALRVVLVQPEQRLRTADAREVLPAQIDRQLFIRQSANIAAMVSAFANGDLALLCRALDDRIAEPARAPLLPGFASAKRAALAAGAVGCSISGAGPTSFAFAVDDASADRIASAMRSAYEESGVSATSRVGRIDPEGARVL